jgi:hypothetical protein
MNARSQRRNLRSKRLQFILWIGHAGKLPHLPSQRKGFVVWHGHRFQRIQVGDAEECLKGFIQHLARRRRNRSRCFIEIRARSAQTQILAIYWQLQYADCFVPMRFQNGNVALRNIIAVTAFRHWRGIHISEVAARLLQGEPS